VFALLVIAGVFVGAALFSGPALADDRDSATVGKITLLNRKAVDAYQHLEFETAVRLLNEALDQSERAGLTQHPIRARTYVTLGIVTIGGFKQRADAVKYFRKALQIQPEVRLSPGLANPEIQAAFDDAIAGLSSGGGGDLPPEKALVHEPVHVGQTGQPVPIAVTPDKDLEASAVVLRYRATNASSFTDVSMKRGLTGALEAAIPASATAGEQVAYFIEARRNNGTVLVGRGTAADPIVVALAKPAGTAAVATTTPSSRAAESDKRLFFAILGGTGFGWATGTGEATGNPVVSPGVDWTPTGQLAPELGYFFTPQLMLGVQGRFQMVRGATPYHIDDAVAGECGGDKVCEPYTGAFAGLLKATLFLSDPQNAFQPFLSLSAGAGTIRHVSKVRSPATCGSGSEACVDTVPGGPVLFGPGFGFQYRVADGVGIIAGIGALLGVPKFTAHADVNVGVAFQL
jgi:tetratricopeptide repeat protein